MNRSILFTPILLTTLLLMLCACSGGGDAVVLSRTVCDIRYVYGTNGSMVRADEFSSGKDFTHEQEHYQRSHLYSYDEAGNKISDICVELSDEFWGDTAIEDAAYSSVASCTLSIDDIMGVAEQAKAPIDEDSTVLEGVLASSGLSDGMLLQEAHRYEYDSTGRVVSDCSYFSSGALRYALRYEYDDLGNVIHEELADPWAGTISHSKHELEYDSDGNVIRDSCDDASWSHVITRSYDNGLLVRERTDARSNDKSFPESSTTFIEYEYDENGRLVREGGDLSNPNAYSFAYEYDEEDRLTMKWFYEANGEDAWFYTYRYDDEGRLVEEGINVEVRNRTD